MRFSIASTAARQRAAALRAGPATRRAIWVTFRRGFCLRCMDGSLASVVIAVRGLRSDGKESDESDRNATRRRDNVMRRLHGPCPGRADGQCECRKISRRELAALALYNRCGLAVERHSRSRHNNGVDAAETRQTAVILYERLRALARMRMAGERGSHTLDATGLANEAILRLLRCEPDRINDEEHFFALAAEAMRRVLVEHARARARDKRGGGQASQSLDEIDNAIQLRSDPAEVIAMDEALSILEAQDAQAATIVKLRSFGGMDPEEIAALLNVSRRTVER